VATSKWTHPRHELIAIGVRLARQGYHITSIAEHLVLRHFTGRDRKRAEKHLAGAIARQFWMKHAGRTERQEEIADMAATLHAEGWKPIFDGDDERCFWLHKPTGLSVNCNGDFFYNYAAATRATYESATRAILREES
jgi:hypothetical protein